MGSPSKGSGQRWSEALVGIRVKLREVQDQDLRTTQGQGGHMFPPLLDDSLLVGVWALLCRLPVMGWQAEPGRIPADTQLTAFYGEDYVQIKLSVFCPQQPPTHAFNTHVLSTYYVQGCMYNYCTNYCQLIIDKVTYS